MFPCYENTSEWDDFGEVINPDDYVIKDEDMNPIAMHVSFFFKTSTSQFQYVVFILKNLPYCLYHLCILD